MNKELKEEFNKAWSEAHKGMVDFSGVYIDNPIRDFISQKFVAKNDAKNDILRIILDETTRMVKLCNTNEELLKVTQLGKDLADKSYRALLNE